MSESCEKLISKFVECLRWDAKHYKLAPTQNKKELTIVIGETLKNLLLAHAVQCTYLSEKEVVTTLQNIRLIRKCFLTLLSLENMTKLCRLSSFFFCCFVPTFYTGKVPYNGHLATGSC